MQKGLSDFANIDGFYLKIKNDSMDDLKARENDYLFIFKLG